MKKLVLALMGISLAVVLVSGCQKKEEAPVPAPGAEMPAPADTAVTETPAK